MRNPQGSILFLVVLMLALLSILGFSAMHTSTVERLIATNELLHQQYFYTAEAGIAYALGDLRHPFAEANADRLASGIDAAWDFALETAGSVEGGDPDDPGQGSYERGVRWIEDQPLSGSHFRVTLWNNDETLAGGDANTDLDGLLWLRSDASGPRGGGASIQVLLHSDAGGIAVTDYPAQYGAGAGKNYNAVDLDPIESFQPQR